MTWTKLDDGFIDHPKIVSLSPAAIGVHVCGLVWCGKHLTDGEITKGAERRLTSAPNVARYVAELVDAGLWRDRGDHWLIHDYLDYQPSREKVLADRAADAERKRLAREARAAKRAAEKAQNVTALRAGTR